MRKFWGLIILMGQDRKRNIRDYWSNGGYAVAQLVEVKRKGAGSIPDGVIGIFH